MEIRQITDEDLPQLALLYQQLQPNEPSVTKMHYALQAILENPNQIVLVAVINGQLVGTALGIACQMLFGQCKSFFVVEDVVVDADHQRAGVGTALMVRIEQFAVERNCSYIMLITDTDREQAHAFYEALGYHSDSYEAFKKKL